MISHEKLNVYQKALVCVAALNDHGRSWDKRHALVDHLLRASESILMNLVEGTRLRGTANRQLLPNTPWGRRWNAPPAWTLRCKPDKVSDEVRDEVASGKCPNSRGRFIETSLPRTSRLRPP